MLRPGTRELEFERSVFFFSSLEISFEHTFDVLSTFSYSHLLSQKKWVLAYAGLDCCCERAGISQRGSHLISFGGRFDPYWLLSLLDSVLCPLYALEGSDWFVVIIFFDKICKLSSSYPKSFGIWVELPVKRLQIFTIRCWFNIFSNDFMLLHSK